MTDTKVSLGPITLATPLVAASGSVGSVVEFASTTDFSKYGAAVVKSVAPEPWEGRPTPRIAPVVNGMLNGIGIQNPGVDEWIVSYGGQVAAIETDVWGSVVAHDVDGFGRVAAAMESVPFAAIEVNLSCPNLDGLPFALDASSTAEVIATVRAATERPIGAKLTSDAYNIGEIASAAIDAGADWLVVANTVRGASIDVATRRPLLSGLIGGYSGEPIRPIAVRAILDVRAALPDVPIVGCGGVSHADHAVELMLAGADAIGIGSAHFADPRIATKIMRGLERYAQRNGIDRLAELKGAYEPW